MTAHAIRIDQFHHARLSQRVLVHLLVTREQRIAIDVPTKRRMRNSKIKKNVLVEFVFSKKQLVHAREKRAGLSALNDAMIVGAADCNCFADAELRQNRSMNRLILGGKFDRARG